MILLRTCRAVLRKICFLAIVSLASAQIGQVMPTIEGETISGRKVILPDASRGKIAVLIFGFTKSSKEPSGAWADRVQAEFGSRAGFEMYQLPVLEDVPRFIRGMVISGMKKGVRENMRDHFMPIEQHESELKQLVSYKGHDDAYLIVLDTTGHIVHQTHGPFSDARYREFGNEVQRLLSQER